RPPQPRDPARAPVGVAEEPCVSAVLHAPDRTLARARRPRRRRLQDRRGMAAARAGHGADDRAGRLHRTERAPSAEALARDRHPDRGRRARRARGPRGADGRAAERPGRDRAADGRAMTTRTPDACDVLIVGGGLVGSALAAALAELPLSTVLVEARDPATLEQPSFDA